MAKPDKPAGIDKMKAASQAVAAAAANVVKAKQAYHDALKAQRALKSPEKR